MITLNVGDYMDPAPDPPKLRDGNDFGVAIQVRKGM